MNNISCHISCCSGDALMQQRHITPQSTQTQWQQRYHADTMPCTNQRPVVLSLCYLNQSGQVNSESKHTEEFSMTEQQNSQQHETLSFNRKHLNLRADLSKSQTHSVKSSDKCEKHHDRRITWIHLTASHLLLGCETTSALCLQLK